MARPLKTRPVRPQDKLSALNAALRHGRMDAAAIAEYCGLSKHSVKSCKFYLPAYGCAAKTSATGPVCRGIRRGGRRV